MIQSLPIKKLRTLGMFAFIAAVAVSCGSYQQSSYNDNDGIYANERRQVGVERPTRPVAQQRQGQPNDAYSQYFGQQADQYDQILDSEVFTDIDSYASGVENDSLATGDLTDYYQSDNDYAGQAGWGENARSVNINVYGGGGGFGFGSPWLWNGWNNWGYGGFGYAGFYNPWRFGRWNRWNNWGWGGFGYGYAGFGWGGFNNPWFCPPGYYGYGGYYGNGYGYSRRNYAFNNGRRGYYNNIVTNTSARTAALRGRSNLNTRRGTSARYRNSSNVGRYANSRSARSNRRGIATRRAVGVDRNRTYRSSRSTRAIPRYNSATRSNQTYRSTTPRSSNYRSGTRSGSVRTRSVTPRTSNYRRSSGTRSNGYSRSNSRSRTNQSYRSSAPRRSNYRSSAPSRSSSRSGSFRSSSSSRSSSGSFRSSRSSSSRSSSGRSSGRRQ